MSDLTVYPDIEQRSEEWYEQRRGIVTASSVGQLITSRTLTAIEFACPSCGAAANNPCIGKRSPEPIKTLHPERATAAREDDSPPLIEPASNDESRGLTALLVAERITGYAEPTRTTDDMWRGILCEPIARDAYSQHHHAPVTEFGFMRRDGDGWSLGLSPDGIVGEEGLIEIKCPRAKTHIRTILADEVPSQYVAQCQAALLVSGREWVDFVSFYGGLPLFVKRVFPDPRWFAAIEAACRRFEETATATVAEYKGRVIGLPTTERIPDSLELAV